MTDRRARSDLGSRRSEWVDTTCSTCGSPVSRRKSEVRAVVYCSRKCYRIKPIPGPGRPRDRALVPGETTKVNGEGYRMLWLGRGVGPYNGWAMEHRHVMAAVLGRPLTADENVHHINGVKTDNRPENLELWSRSQPAGQRVEDKVEWAVTLLRTYAPHLLYPESDVKGSFTA